MAVPLPAAGGSAVCMWERQGSEIASQLFRAVAIAGSDCFCLENAQGSAGLVLEAKDGGGQGARLQM